MHQKIITEWNKRVKNTEHIYVLGDFSFGSIDKTTEILSQLSGYKIIIKGNHDMPAHKLIKMGFDEVHENLTFVLPGGIKVFLSHFPFHPMTKYQKLPDGAVFSDEASYVGDRRYLHKRIVDDGEKWLIHGHVHNSWKQSGKQINVGVDVWDFKPVSHEQIVNLINRGASVKKAEDYTD